MNEKTIKMEVTEQEAEFLLSVRNYLKSYPNGYPELLWDIEQQFDRMIDPFEEW